MTNLKPCPFCGGEAKYRSCINVQPIIDDVGAYVGADEYYFEKCGCENCGIWFESCEDDYEPEEITIERWNKRVGELDDEER